MDEERFDFESLRVYQKALEYVDFVYEITRSFPKIEILSLTAPNSERRTENDGF